MALEKDYEKQMISVDVSIYSIIDRKLHVLLIQRNEEPFKDMWSLVGGKVYNYESCENAVAREVNEKIGTNSIVPYLSGVFSEPNRDIRYRNISISYYCLVKYNELEHNLNTLKVKDAKWFSVDDIPALAFDHNKILKNSLEILKTRVYDIDFMKKYLPETFTLVELQNIYENILNVRLDKRNFRRKLTSLNCLESTGEKNQADSRKKSEIFRFK